MRLRGCQKSNHTLYISKIRYNRFPTVSLEERVAAAKALEGVSEVVVQKNMMYDDVIASLKPDARLLSFKEIVTLIDA